MFLVVVVQGCCNPRAAERGAAPCSPPALQVILLILLSLCAVCYAAWIHSARSKMEKRDYVWVCMSPSQLPTASCGHCSRVRVCVCVCVRLSTWVLWAAQPCNTCGRSWPQSAVHIYILILVWSAGRVNFSLQPTEWACVLAAADFWMLAVRYWTWIWHTATALPLVLFRRCLWEKLKSLLMLSFKMKMGGGSLLLQHINKEQWMKNMLLCDIFLESVSSLYRFISVFFSRTCWTSRKAGWWNLTSKARYHFY